MNSLRWTILLTLFLSYAALPSRSETPPSCFWFDGPNQIGTNFFNEHETRERLIAARQLGLNWIRLTPSKWKSSMPHAMAGDFLIGPKGHYRGLIKKDLEYLIHILDMAHEENVKVVLTFLDLPGRRWKQHNLKIEENKFWESFEAQDDAIQFFTDLLSQIKGHPALVGINPMNEPFPEGAGIPLKDWYQEDYLKWYQIIKNTPQDLNLFYTRLIKNIRKISAAMPIILDSGYYATPWAVKMMQPMNDPFVLYSFHFYEPYAYTFQTRNYSYPGLLPLGEDPAHQTTEFWNLNRIQKFFQPVKDWQNIHQIPDSKIIVSEFGVRRNASGAKDYLKDVIQVLNENHWHWAFYSFREDSFAGMDYELGTSKKTPYPYWDYIEAHLMPNYSAMKDRSLIQVIQNGIQTHQKTIIPPPMGWNSWNEFGKNINEQLIRENIEILSESSFKEAGYRIAVVDGGWRSEKLGKNGELVPDLKKFPNGIKPLADLAHSKGLKFGIHVVAGTHDCGKFPTGSKDHEEQHLKQLVSWGVDFIKLDQCILNNTEDWPAEDLKRTYTKWHQLIEAEQKPIFLSLSTYQYQDWNPNVGQMGRTTQDIKPKIFGGAIFDSDFTGEFLSVMDIAEKNNRLAPKAIQGYWNDPDLLVIGDSHLSLEEQKSHFALWSIMTAPLFLSLDLRTISADVKNIILNQDAISINQDTAEQGRRLKQDGFSEVWLKHLSDGNLAILLLNRDPIKTVKLHFTAKEIGMLKKFTVRDIDQKKTLGTFSDLFSASVKPRSSLFLRINQEL